MLMREVVVSKQPLTPAQQQDANIRRQQKALKVKKAQLTAQKAQERLRKARSGTYS